MFWTLTHVFLSELTTPVKTEALLWASSHRTEEASVSTSVEKEKHEGRIASALKIDQKISRYLEAQDVTLDRQSSPKQVGMGISGLTKKSGLLPLSQRGNGFSQLLRSVICLGSMLYAWSEFRGVQLLYGTHPDT
ncbi:hypothetical protein ACHAQC_006410 [Fusarium culmorum]